LLNEVAKEHGIAQDVTAQSWPHLIPIPNSSTSKQILIVFFRATRGFRKKLNLSA
jgi:hypothetical protein